MSAPDPQLEQALRRMASVAAGNTLHDGHIDEPLLALLRHGDPGDDLGDALVHVAHCALCRARLTEGHLEGRRMVVMAIEAPRGSQRNLQRAAEGARALLLERGEGRWAAVVAESRAEALQGALEQRDSSLVSRWAVATPFEVPTEELRQGRGRADSLMDPAETGTFAAELQAWMRVARKPRHKAGGISAFWLSLAILCISGAVALAYVLATQI